MRFHGRIRFGDVEDELDVAVEVDETHVRLISGEEPLGSWCLADVVANRLVANEFEIDLDGETVIFLAEDQVNFAYGAVQSMAEGWARYHAMNPVRRRRAVNAARRSAHPSRLEEVRRALREARETLVVRTTHAAAELSEGQHAPEPIPPARPPEPVPSPQPSGFWAKVEAATAQEQHDDESISMVEVPADPSRHRLPRIESFPRRPSPIPRNLRDASTSNVEDDAPVPWIQPSVDEVPIVDVPASPVPPPVSSAPPPVMTSTAVTSTPYSDGHHPAETSGLRATFRSLFTRKAKEPHQHSFVASTTAVGITRRVCLECGYVSIGVSEREG